MATEASTSKSFSSFFRPQTQQSVVKAETLWSVFTAKHNIPFLTSDHATMIFKKMFTDSEIGIKISCSRTKITVIVKNTLAPYCHQKEQLACPTHSLYSWMNLMTKLTRKMVPITGRASSYFVFFEFSRPK